MEICPFRAHAPQAALDDLRERLERTRLPKEEGEPREARGSGIDLEELAGFCDHWRKHFDWRAVEDRINGFPNFQATIDGLRIHFLRADGRGPRPMPILITHGWPGSFLEMLELVPLLTDPGAHGADPADSFDVVVPSIPGYGFSDAGGPGTTPRRIAEVWRALMDGLGYRRYGLQGGDWGASVATWLGRDHPEAVAGIHLNYVPGSYAPDLSPGSRPLTDAERAFLASRDEWLEREGGYAHIQATSPRTLAAALNDSPAGLAAWILEKFQAWSDCGGRLESRFSKDELLANVTLYWITGTILSSIRLYGDSRSMPLRFAAGQRCAVPTAVARFPKEDPSPPREWVERGYDLRRWTEMPRGGHFAAMEEPELLARDIREFFRPLR